MSKNEKSNSTGMKIGNIVGIILCVILIPVLAINITLIVKSLTKPESVPSAGGYLPLIVLTDSMYPTIESGDLIICHSLEAEDVNVGDIIAFFDPAGNGSSIVTHRVTALTTKDGELAFTTKGDANNTEDEKPVPATKLVGIYKARIPNAGHIAMFMQTTPGLLVCVLLPLILLVGYDMLRRRKFEVKKDEESAALLAELERLRALQAEKEKNESK